VARHLDIFTVAQRDPEVRAVAEGLKTAVAGRGCSTAAMPTRKDAGDRLTAQALVMSWCSG
jgi:hypothetical protein